MHILSIILFLNYIILTYMSNIKHKLDISVPLLAYFWSVQQFNQTWENILVSAGKYFNFGKIGQKPYKFDVYNISHSRLCCWIYPFSVVMQGLRTSTLYIYIFVLSRWEIILSWKCKWNLFLITNIRPQLCVTVIHIFQTKATKNYGNCIYIKWIHNFHFLLNHS